MDACHGVRRKAVLSYVAKRGENKGSAGLQVAVVDGRPVLKNAAAGDKPIDSSQLWAAMNEQTRGDAKRAAHIDTLMEQTVCCICTQPAADLATKVLYLDFEKWEKQRHADVANGTPDVFRFLGAHNGSSTHEFYERCHCFL